MTWLKRTSICVAQSMIFSSFLPGSKVPAPYLFSVNAINVVNNILEGNRNIGIFANSGTVVSECSNDAPLCLCMPVVADPLQ